MAKIGPVTILVTLAMIAIAHKAEARARHEIIVCDRQGCRGAAAGAAPSRSWHHQARKPSHRTSAPRRAIVRPFRGGGWVVSRKTGARARVRPALAATFQAYVNDLEAAGAVVRFMGGYRPGPCAPMRHKHPCGMALDVCQTARDVVDRRCRLPARAAMIAIARRHGLTEGGQWCHGDRGHAEAGAAVGACTARRGRSAREAMAR